MPVNCAAAPATPAPVPPSTSTQEGVERQIGDVLLAIVELSGRALEEVHDGGRMRGDTKRQGGDLVAKLYEWQQSMPEPDFVTLLRRQGRLAAPPQWRGFERSGGRRDHRLVARGRGPGVRNNAGIGRTPPARSLIS